jgi:hypothetical protein
MKAMAQVDESRLRHLIEVDQVTQQQAADRLGVTRHTVEKYCKLLCLKTQRTGPRSGDKHPDWKGGRVLVGGYWYVWNNTHPNRTKQNRVAEHRLVVESMIGRYLEKHEVVHHINGNPQDNRPENLALFPSNSEHLRHELTGKVPQWAPEGLERIQAGLRKKRKYHPRTSSCVQERNQTTGRFQTKGGHKVEPLS